MQVSVESTGNLERRMSFSLPEDRVKSSVSNRLREIGGTVRMNGFRPGKVPSKVVEQRFGPQVRAEVLENMLRETFDDAVRENDLRLAGSPRIDQVGESGFDFVATFEVMPDFGDIDVSQLDIVRETAEVVDADIDQMIENLRLQRRTWDAVERPVKEGDLVAVETWTETGGLRLPPEGAESGRIVIGSGAMLAELEQALVGMSRDEEKTVAVDFPAEWPMSQLAGKEAQVHLKVMHVSEPLLPEVNEALVKSFGIGSGDVEQFRREIRTNLERELKGALAGRLRREVGDHLIAAYSGVALPPRMIENEARAILQQSIEQMRQSGRDPGTPPENAHEQFLDVARKRVLVGLLVGEIARRNQLRLDPKRVNETLRLIASTYEEPEQVVEMYRKDPQLMGGLQSRVMEEQVIDWIAERAQHTEKSLSFQEAIRPQ
ncbi:MAG: trigger factor [Xanthomonadaceae bacterium]|nr:trigger factor [Xanthomonadaceae bacterium]